MKLLYLDLETTGLDSSKNAIIEIAGILEADNFVQESFLITMSPDEDQIIDPQALQAINKTEEEIKLYNNQKDGYYWFLQFLEKYVNPYDKQDKLFLVGYNIHAFDIPFLRNFFSRNNNKYFGSYFHHPSIDVMLLISYFSMKQREKIPNFKLATIAKSLGIDVNDSLLHNAMYDVEITRDIYKRIELEYVN